jgi:hypothetical protein
LTERLFRGTVFVGDCLLYGLTFRKGADFSPSRVQGHLIIARLTLSGSLFWNSLAVAEDGELELSVSWAPAYARIQIDGVTVDGTLALTVAPVDQVDLVIDGLRASQSGIVRVTQLGDDGGRGWLKVHGWIVADDAVIDLPTKVPGIEQTSILGAASQKKSSEI